MGKRKRTGMLLAGSVTASGITFYTTNDGRNVVRAAHSVQPRRNSRTQFAARQRMRHTTMLWQQMRDADPMFSSDKSAYARFASLANRLPVVYIPRNGALDGASLLMPGIPVSYGTLPTVKQRLGEVDGMPALVTDLGANELQRGEALRLYTLCQCIVGQKPMVRISYEDIPLSGTELVDGCIALVGSKFADEMTGWALVRIDGDRCSSQVAVTRCTYYETFTTEEAMMKAAESYGGLTK